jgi:excisionase family DNA binding protein
MVNENIVSDLLSIPQAAKVLGISRIALYKRVKNGQIRATRVGKKIYFIRRQDLPDVFATNLTATQKKDIKKGVSKVVTEYGETLKLLGKE